MGNITSRLGFPIITISLKINTVRGFGADTLQNKVD